MTVMPTVPTSLLHIKNKIQNGENVSLEDLINLKKEEGDDNSFSMMTKRLEESHIPYLNRSFAEKASPGNKKVIIIRYIGMVQDILDLEFYSSKSENGKCTKYQDMPLQPDDSSSINNVHMVHEMVEKEFLHSSLAERQPVFVVPLPFASPWISSYADSSFNTSRTKDMDCFSQEDRQIKGKGKRTFCEYANDIEEHTENNDESNSKKKNSIKPPMSTSSSIVTTSSSMWWEKGTMNSDEDQVSVLANFYPENQLIESNISQTTNNIRLNDIVEIVGVLSLDPLDADFSAASSFRSCEEGGYIHPFQSDLSRTNLPPPSQLPRIHVLYHQPIDLDQLALSKSVATTLLANQHADASLRTEDDRSLTINFFSKHIFQGDDIAAEALLMSLLSVTERNFPLQQFSEHQSDTAFMSSLTNRNRFTPKRIPAGSCVGSLSLNLILSQSCNPSASCQLNKKLQSILQLILPIVSVMDLSLATLNDPNAISVPSKATSDNFDSFSSTSCDNRLSTSPMQLPRGSMLILNEHDLVEPNLNSNGKSCLRGLSCIAERQICEYRFGMHDFPFEADYSVVALSHKRKSIVETSTYMKISLGQEYELDNFPVETIARIRSYISRCRVPLGVSMSKEICETAEKMFVARRRLQRKEGKARLDGEVEFHRWLTLCRAQARSRFGANKNNLAPCSDNWNVRIQLDDWTRAVNLDDEMIASMNQRS